MDTQVCQRWRDARDSYRPKGEPIQTREYEVALIPDDKTARAFVQQHHYSGSYPAARLRSGLFHRGELVGVAVLSQPSSQAALDAALPFRDVDRAELGRLVLLDRVPANGESWFLARTWELAKSRGFGAIVSHSDPMPRKDAEGRVLFVGHVGTVYQALSATYVGLTPRRTRRVLPDGRTVDGRALSKLRSGERGREYVTEQLVRYGATAPTGDWAAWIKLAVQTVSRPVRHTGSYRYLFALDKATRRHLPQGQKYPKVTLDA